LRQAT
jgi:hypothetical protein